MQLVSMPFSEEILWFLPIYNKSAQPVWLIKRQSADSFNIFVKKTAAKKTVAESHPFP